MYKNCIALILLCLTLNSMAMIKKSTIYSVRIHQTKATKTIKYPLHYAAETGDIEKIKNLIPQCTNIDIQDNKGRTPLFTAVQHNKKKAAALFLKYGADIDKQTNIGTTPLIEAIKNESLKCTLLLLKKGADPTIGTPRPPENYLVEFYGETPHDEKITENFKFIVPVHSELLNRRLKVLYRQEPKEQQISLLTKTI